MEYYNTVHLSPNVQSRVLSNVVLGKKIHLRARVITVAVVTPLKHGAGRK